MSTQNQKPDNSPTPSPKSSVTTGEPNAVSQRAQEIANQNRELRAVNADNREAVVSINIPRSMKTKISELNDFLGLSTENLLYSSLQSIISYAKAKEIQIRQIKGYPKERNSDSDKLQPVELELDETVVDELKRQNLLSEVSECAILGLDFLYLRLIELNKIG